MARKPGRAATDWKARREEFINRRVAGEQVSISEFAAEVGVTKCTAMRHLRGAVKEAGELSAEYSRRAREEVGIDHTRQRVGILRKAVPLGELLKEEFDYALAHRRHLREQAVLRGDPFGVEPLRPSELRALETAYVEMQEVGGGLPKVHEVHHDEVHEEVVTNRAQMARAQENVVQLAQWKRQRRRASAQAIEPPKEGEQG